MLSNMRHHGGSQVFGLPSAQMVEIQSKAAWPGRQGSGAEHVISSIPMEILIWLEVHPRDKMFPDLWQKKKCPLFNFLYFKEVECWQKKMSIAYTIAMAIIAI